MADGVERVLVTGVSGFIANHVLKQLLEAGHLVRGTIRSLSNEAKVQAIRDIVPGAGDRLELMECDLMDGVSTWTDVVSGCSHIIHIASPLPSKTSKDDMDIIKPAVEGTKSVLMAAAESGTVKRVVLTSSIMAIIGTFDGGKYSEENWADLKSKQDQSKSSAYSRSKTIAERAAWAFVNDLPDDKKFELVAINPGCVIGPVLTKNLSITNEAYVAMFLNGSLPALSNVNYPLVDVRDVAKAHVLALSADDVDGQRFIINTDHLWMKEVADIYREEFGPLGYTVPHRMMPDFLSRILFWFLPGLEDIRPGIGKKTELDNSRMQSMLIFTPLDVRKSIKETAHSLIQWGLIPKSDQYKPASASVSEVVRL